MSELIEKNVTDLIGRIQKLESSNSNENEDVLLNLDRAVTGLAITVNSLVGLLLDKKVISKEELTKFLKEENIRVDEAMRAMLKQKEDPSAKGADKGTEAASGEAKETS